jgi:hypothetical protein
MIARSAYGNTLKNSHAPPPNRMKISAPYYIECPSSSPRRSIQCLFNLPYTLMKCPSLATPEQRHHSIFPAWPGSDQRKNRRMRSGSLTAPSPVSCGSFRKRAWGLFSRRTKMVDLEKSVLKRNDLRCLGAPVNLNPNAVLKSLCFQSLFSEHDQFCSPVKQRP